MLQKFEIVGDGRVNGTEGHEQDPGEEGVDTGVVGLVESSDYEEEKHVGEN